MQDHSTGPSEGVRQGSTVTRHSLNVLFSSTVNRKWLRIKASPTKPVMLVLRELGVTAFNAGTTNQYRIGTASAGAQVLALRNTPAAGSSVEVAVITPLLTADTDIWIGTSLTGTAATTGNMWLTLDAVELNVNNVNANAIP